MEILELIINTLNVMELIGDLCLNLITVIFLIKQWLFENVPVL